jgi:hypothetical protein
MKMNHDDDSYNSYEEGRKEGQKEGEGLAWVMLFVIVVLLLGMCSGNGGFWVDDGYVPPN